MSSAQITGGTVEFTRPSNYSTDKSGAKVTLTFSCAEGAPISEAEAMLDRVVAMSIARAMRMVGEVSKLETGGQYGKPAFQQAAEAQPSWSGPSVGSKVGEDRRNTTTDLMGNVVAENPTVGSTTAPVQNLIGAGQDQVASDAGTTKSPSEISDKTLLDAISAKNGAFLKASKDDDRSADTPAGTIRIRALIAKYAPPPAPARAIPQEKRQEFLSELAAL